MSQFKGKAPTHNVGSRQEFRGNSEPAPGQLRRTGTTYIEGSTWENLSILSLGKFTSPTRTMLISSKMVGVSVGTGLYEF
jgi:hypothetical protein